MTTLMAKMAELAEEGIGQPVASRARELLAKMILPKRVTGEIIGKYVRKAIRVGAWRYLKQESRALLIIARRWRLIKSPTLKSILYKIFLEIELYTLRGKALFYGIILAMKNTIYKLQEALKDYSKLLTIGIFYLNNPLMYRIYG